MGEGARPGAYRVDHDTSATEGMEFQLMNKFVVEALDPSSGEVVSYEVEASYAGVVDGNLGLFEDAESLVAAFSSWLNVRRTAVA